MLTSNGETFCWTTGATAAVLATYHEKWFPQRFFGSDAVYWRLSQNKDLGDIRSRIFKLTNETESRCEDSDKLIKVSWSTVL